jgi:hypothetical protein
MLRRELADAFSHGEIPLWALPVANDRGGNSSDPARLTLRRLPLLAELFHQLSTSFRRYHCFPSTSFIAAFSSIASARSFFSRLFLSSKLRSFLASLTFIPVLLTPNVERRIANPMLPAQLLHRYAALSLLQGPHYLLFFKSSLTHRFTPFHLSTGVGANFQLLLFSGGRSGGD